MSTNYIHNKNESNDNFYLKYLARPHNNINSNTKNIQQLNDLQSYIYSLMQKNITICYSEYLLNVIKNELIIIDVLDSIINKI